MITLTFITGNLNKVQQLSNWLDFPLDHVKLDIHEIQSVDLTEVVVEKAKLAYAQIKKPVIVDDTALTFHALGKLPGPFIKFFQNELGLDGCCKILEAYKDRKATATVMYGVTFDGLTVETFMGMTSGTIAPAPKGELGYGWDPIFIPDGLSSTYAEMTQDEVKSYSPRAKAIELLRDFLNEKKAPLYRVL